MNTFAKIVLISSAFALAATSVNAADVNGNVETTVKVKNVEQKATGLANKNELNVGSIDGKNTKVGGNVKINVKADNISQKATGLANKNEMNIGSVSE
jgi:hypothetical protein